MRRLCFTPSFALHLALRLLRRSRRNAATRRTSKSRSAITPGAIADTPLETPPPTAGTEAPGDVRAIAASARSGVQSPPALAQLLVDDVVHLHGPLEQASVAPDQIRGHGQLQEVPPVVDDALGARQHRRQRLLEEGSVRPDVLLGGVRGVPQRHEVDRTPQAGTPHRRLIDRGHLCTSGSLYTKLFLFLVAPHPRGRVPLTLRACLPICPDRHRSDASQMHVVVCTLRCVP